MFLCPSICLSIDTKHQNMPILPGVQVGELNHLPILHVAYPILLLKLFSNNPCNQRAIGGIASLYFYGTDYLAHGLRAANT